jgi:hypothetical protein
VGAAEKAVLRFALSGRIRWLLFEGALVEGTVNSASGIAVATGTRLAVLEVPTQEPRLDVLRAEIEVLEIRREMLAREAGAGLSDQIAEVERRIEEREKELSRWQELERQGAKTEKNLAQTESEIAEAREKLALLKSGASPSQSELELVKAQLDLKREELRQTEREKTATLLYSPLEGRLSSVAFPSGSFTQAHQPVGEVVAMDPLLVLVEVSPDSDGEWRMGETVALRSTRTGESAVGVVTGSHSQDKGSGKGVAEVRFRNRQVSLSEASGEVLAGGLPLAVGLRPIPENLAAVLGISETVCLPASAVGRNSEGKTFVARWTPAAGAGLLRHIERVPIVAGTPSFRGASGDLFVPLRSAQGLGETDLILLDPSLLEEARERVWLFQPGERMEVRRAEMKEPRSAGL